VTRVLGIDPGSIRTGFGIIDYEEGSCTLITSGVIELDEATAVSERLVNLSSDLEDLLSRHRVDEVALESLFFSVNAQSALKLGQARGVILLECARRNLPIHEYSPAQVKSSVCGSGRAKKEQIAQMVKVLLKIPAKKAFHTFDQADALALALTHSQMISLNRRLNGKLNIETEDARK